MKKPPISACALLAALAALAAACAPVADGAAPVAATALPGDATDAERLASLLVDADAAGEGAQRDRIVATIDRIGLAALDGAPDDPLARWKASGSAGTPPMRGRALGRGYRRAKIGAGSRVELEQLFLAGEAAEIAAAARGGTPIDFVILDKGGRTVCDTQIAPRATCRWLPTYSARYRIRLANRSARDTSVYLVVE